MILCTGSIAFDTTRTPFKTVERALGGAATYFSLAARFYSPVGVVSAVGSDFGEAQWKQLALPGIDWSGVQRVAGEKTFFFDSSFSYDLNSRKANKTEENVLAEFEPLAPPGMAEKAEFVYLATLRPEKQLKLLRQVGVRRLCVLDTIEHYIKNDLQELEQVISQVDGIVLNDAEARMIAQTPNLLKAGKTILEKGPTLLVIKKGENGCLLFFGGRAYPFPAFPLEEIEDPTGAGDAFAGGFVGYLAKHGRGRAELDARALRNAVAHGTVMGSFAVEEFSIGKLAKIGWQDVERRLGEYKALLNF